MTATRSLLLLMLTALATGPALAQAPAANPNTMPQLLNTMHDALTSNNNIGFHTPDNRYEGRAGTPYFLPDWANAELTRPDGVTMTRLLLKYNIYGQVLLLRRTITNDSLEVAPEQIDRFTLHGTEGQTWLFRRLAPTTNQPGSVPESGYFLVLHDGKTTLLKRLGKEIQRANYQGTYSPNLRHDTFLDKFAYYLLRPDNTLVQVHKSRTSLLNAFGPQRASVETFADQNRIGGRTEPDMIRLVQHVNSLP
jgi:hypothetical protein